MASRDAPVAEVEPEDRMIAATNELVLQEAAAVGVQADLVSASHGILKLSLSGKSAMIRGVRAAAVASMCLPAG